MLDDMSARSLDLLIHCMVGCCFHDMLSIARRILVYVSLSRLFILSVRVQVEDPYTKKDSTVALILFSGFQEAILSIFELILLGFPMS